MDVGIAIACVVVLIDSSGHIAALQSSTNSPITREGSVTVSFGNTISEYGHTQATLLTLQLPTQIDCTSAEAPLQTIGYHLDY